MIQSMTDISPIEDPGFGVYIHWPFCQSKCPYCDFNSHVRQNGIDEERFLKSYLKELEHIAELTPNRTIASIFFGGGTPSLMPVATIDKIINHCGKLWSLPDETEITMEANPTSVEAQRFQGYRNAGVNRVSIGVQALNDEDLQRLGRLHSAEEALQAIKIASSTFERYSFDLIYARPQQTPEQWHSELLEALKWSVGHLSLYQLTIEPGTRFSDLYASGKLTIPNSEMAEEHYQVTQDVCDDAGLPAYEISNHAANGQQCLHNLIYWNYGEYAGIGPGAHGRINIKGTTTATACKRLPEAWLEAVEVSGNGFDETEQLSFGQQADEMLLMGLRLSDGLNLTRLKQVTGANIDPEQLSEFIEADLLIYNPKNDRLTATKNGRFVLNHLIGQVARVMTF